MSLPAVTTISVEELQAHTSEWVHHIGPVHIVENGQVIARLVPEISPKSTSKTDPAVDNPFLRRKLRPGYAAIMHKTYGGKSVDEHLSEDRDGR